MPLGRRKYPGTLPSLARNPPQTRYPPGSFIIHIRFEQSFRTSAICLIHCCPPFHCLPSPPLSLAPPPDSRASVPLGLLDVCSPIVRHGRVSAVHLAPQGNFFILLPVSPRRGRWRSPSVPELPTHRRYSSLARRITASRVESSGTHPGTPRTNDFLPAGAARNYPGDLNWVAGSRRGSIRLENTLLGD